jgi:hypothetical protein
MMDNDRGFAASESVMKISVNFTLFFDKKPAALQILSMYLAADLMTDLDQLAWNITDCDTERQLVEIGTPKLLKAEVRESENDLEVSVGLEFPGENKSVVEQMTKEYLSSFAEYILPTVLEYKSRTGDVPDFNGKPREFGFWVSN